MLLGLDCRGGVFAWFLCAAPPREADDEDYNAAPPRRGAGQQTNAETTRTAPPAGHASARRGRRQQALGHGAAAPEPRQQGSYARARRRSVRPTKAGAGRCDRLRRLRRAAETVLRDAHRAADHQVETTTYSPDAGTPILLQGGGGHRDGQRFMAPTGYEGSCEDWAWRDTGGTGN